MNPITDDDVAALFGATQHPPIFERVLRDLHGRLTHHTYDQPETITTPAQGATMDLTNFENDLKADLDSLEQGVRNFADKHLPAAAQAADWATKAQQSPLVQAALAVALPPGLEADFAEAISKADAAIKAAQAKAAESQPPADAEPLEPLPEVVGEPAPETAPAA